MSWFNKIFGHKKNEPENKRQLSPVDQETAKSHDCFVVPKQQSQGEEQNYSETLKSDLLAAEQGDALAQYRLGEAYSNGNGVEENRSEAAKWYRLAAEQGNTDAQYSLGCMYQKYSWAEHSDAEAMKWFLRAVELGDLRTINYLGVISSNDQDYAEALKWFQLGAEKGDAQAQYNLAMTYDRGDSVSKNIAEAIKWYRLAAEQGHDDALYRLAMLYEKGEGVEKNNAEAIRYYRLAAEHASSGFISHSVGDKYAIGDGVEKDIAEAVKWYQLAALKGYKKAEETLKSIGTNASSSVQSAPQIDILQKNDVDANALLIEGASCGSMEKVKWALETGAKINHEIKEYPKPGSFRGLENASLFEAMPDNKNALDIALNNGYMEIARFLIQNGALLPCVFSLFDTDERESWKNVLFDAARNNHLEVATLALEQGADVNCIGLHGTNPLILASMFGHKSMVTFLLGKGADYTQWSTDPMYPGRKFRTALMWALSEGHGEVVQLLKTAGAKE